MNKRRDFIKNSIGMAAGLGALPALGMTNIKPSTDETLKERLPLMMEEVTNRLAFFDPAEGAVPNPGMGISAFVHSDHMTANYPGPDREERVKQGLRKLDRKAFDYFVSLPFNDNFYLRYEWCDVQKERGKLALPDSWKWILEASEKYGKRWSFRIMNFMPQSTHRNGLPEFLQGRFKMIPYYHRNTVYGEQPYYFPEYSNDYLNYWDELNYLLGEQFDAHPRLEFVDVSGYGLWGEFHHWLNLKTKGGPQANHYPAGPDRLEEIIDRIIKGHLKAYPRTPAALNIHAAEFNAGMKAFEEGLCWARRDSFQPAFRTMEASIAQGLKPGNAMVWEQMMPGSSFPADADLPADRPYLLPQRYFDVQAHYVGIGFNPWVNIWAHENCSRSLGFITQNIGYRLRPALVWHRRIADKEDIVLGLRNDGCSPPPGIVTLNVRFPEGKDFSMELPAGEPVPGVFRMYAAPMPKTIRSYDSDAKITITLKIRMKGKTSPVQWAVRETDQKDHYALEVPLRTSGE